ncbi:MAG: Trk system potassium transporter TrkA [Syntrophomonadaceae bacterium]|jgi:trk system potassium uptake protein TrkA|nr:Trk system potassium transporter TrkA [Syntrophomonadaceae bacterium]
MRVIIIGAGKVGFNLAQMLSMEKHEVMVIEQNEERQEILNEQLDIQVIGGSGSSWEALDEAGIKQADMVVAVTESDELNMVMCLMAKQFGVKTTVARVRNPEYTESHFSAPLSVMGIDLIINPERITALEIAKLVEVPEALNVDYYAGGKLLLVQFKMAPNAPVIGRQLLELKANLPFIVVAVENGQQMLIPGGNYRIAADDDLYVMTRTEGLEQVEKLFGVNRPPTEKITILGGGRVGYYLAHTLETKRPDVEVKIIEKDGRRARKVSHNLNRALVLHGDGTDIDMLEDENVGGSDLFVAVTNDDRLNLLCSLIARNLGVDRTIAQVRRSELLPLMEQVGIDVVVNPQLLTAGAVLKFMRKGDIISVTVLGQNRAEMIELVARPGSRVINKSLNDISFPAGTIVGAIQRGNEVIIPHGGHIIKAGDHVMVFCLPHTVPKIEHLFAGGVR